MSNQMKRVVLYQSDNRYAPILGVSLYSLMVNNRGVDFVVKVIDDGISEKMKEKLVSSAQSFNREIDFRDAATLRRHPLASKFEKYDNFRKNTNSFLKILFIEQSDSERIIYIDCDTIIVKSIESLFHLDLNGNSTAMALDSVVGASYKEKISIKPDHPYFNSGVIVVDTDQWHKDRVMDAIASQLDEGITYNTVDQDYLNIALENRCTVLSPKYNFQPMHTRYSTRTYFKVFQHHSYYYDEDELAVAQDEPVILHVFRYLGLHPWDADSMHPMTAEYSLYSKRSGWFDLIIQKKPSELPMIMKAERLLYCLLPKGAFLRVFICAHNILLNTQKK